MKRLRSLSQGPFPLNRFLLGAWILVFLVCFHGPSVGPLWATEVGVAKVDITPKEPIRLSGYAVRTTPSVGVDDPLHVRTVVFRNFSNSPWAVFVSIDSIGLPAEVTDRIIDQLQKLHQLERKQVVLCSSHSHTTPCLTGSIPNLFGAPLSSEEQGVIDRYTNSVIDSVVQSVTEAFKNTEECELSVGQGETDIATNRRKALSHDGLADRAVRVIRAKNSASKWKAVLFQYACHCTTIGPEVNRISADWAGLAASELESSHPGCVALPIIGCGADANPNQRGAYPVAVELGKKLSSEVSRVLTTSMEPLPPVEQVAFGYVALASERPSREKLQKMLESKVYQETFFASSMLDLWKRKGRIPETYPAPIHLFRFGKELTWVFLGGEVVVDYQFRIQRELDLTKRVWVGAYTDDVFAYIASERIRKEGGYEADQSMLYYNRPGRWESGTEEVLVGRILDLSQNKREIDRPLSPTQSFATLAVQPGYKVELIANEPAIQDPINVAFDSRGRAWVVEMGDYPRGGKVRGRIKILEDRDGDGNYESSKIFLDGLDYPSGVFPWRDGAIVAVAPDLFWARDLDGDDVADEKKVLIQGFAGANPQHRVHGFTYGLDHRLYFGTGDGTRTVVTPSDGKSWTVSGSDLSLDVDRGLLQLHSGKTQFIRGQSDWGVWFGNDNIHPMFHYVVDTPFHDAKRPFRGERNQHMLHPAAAPPVFPSIRDADRFNDLHTANRYTSACSSIVVRNGDLGDSMLGAGVVCEPVHNMVTRFHLIPDGTSYRGARFSEDASKEWLRSSDPWFRPVRAENAPDGSLWVVDMYRRVIEHPEWIPDEWQARIDVRSGEGLGRIYRIVREPAKDANVSNDSNAARENRMKDLRIQTTEAWIERLSSNNGALRDLAQRELIFRAAPESKMPLKELVLTSQSATARLHAFSVLRNLHWDEEKEWSQLLRDPEPRLAQLVLRWALQDHRLQEPDLIAIASSKPVHESAPLAFETLQGMVTIASPKSAPAIASLLRSHGSDRWFQRVIGMFDESILDAVAAQLLNPTGSASSKEFASKDLDSTLGAVLQSTSEGYRRGLLEQVAKNSGSRPAWHFVLATGLGSRAKSTLDSEAYRSLLKDARLLTADPGSSQETLRAAMNLLVDASNELLPQDVDQFFAILESDRTMEMKQLALEGIKKSDSPEIAIRIVNDWKKFAPELLPSLSSSLAARKAWLNPLLEALERATLTVGDLDPSAIERMLTVEDPALQERCKKLLGASAKEVGALIEEYLQGMPPSGNAASGAKIFARQCSLCHSELPGSKSIGPSLSAFQKWTDTMWLTAILDPNRAVEARYRQVSILTEDDEIVTGLLKNETDAELTLATPEGKFVTLPKKELKQLRATDRSLMPEGFSRFLTPNDARDLIEHLRTLSTQPQTPEPK